MSHAVAAHAATIAVRAPAERPAPRRQSASLRNRRRASLSSSSASPSDVANAVGCDGAEGEADSTLVAREGEVSRRGALGGAVVVAAASAFFVGPSPFASPDAVRSSPKSIPQTLSPKPSTLNPQPSTLNPQPSTFTP